MGERAVSGVALLESLPAEERERVEDALEEITVSAGESLARTGDFAWAMYTIVDGSVDVVADDGSLIATLGPGDIFGEVALLIAGRRVANVVARTPLRLKALFTRDFQRIRADVPVFEAELRQLIDARLASLG